MITNINNWIINEGHGAVARQTKTSQLTGINSGRFEGGDVTHRHCNIISTVKLDQLHLIEYSFSAESEFFI